LIGVRKISILFALFLILIFPASIIPSHASQSSQAIPSWVKNTAKWWSEGSVGDNDFAKGLQYLVQHGIIIVPTTQGSSNPPQNIPSWVKNTAKWWAEGQVGDSEFVKGMQYLVQAGIIQVQPMNQTSIMPTQLNQLTSNSSSNVGLIIDTVAHLHTGPSSGGGMTGGMGSGISGGMGGMGGMRSGMGSMSSGMSGAGSSSDAIQWAETGMITMDKIGIQKSLVMPPPAPRIIPNGDYKTSIPVVKKFPDRFAFLGGGGSLNPMIQEAITEGSVTPELKSEFENKAEKIIQDGGIGFGEIASLHISFFQGHPYEEAPPDHELFLLLADIAASHNVPIVFHMEAVTQDMPLPTQFTDPNPSTLKENIKAFERLLDHNTKAKIIWDHDGWDNTGYRTVDLQRQLLEKHPNLYMAIKIDLQTKGKSVFTQNSPIDENGKIRPEWVDLIKSFPYRFIIGSDSFFGIPYQPSVLLQNEKSFLDQLPSDLARKVGYENAVLIYRLT
jgi:predicted TIM-barrel fold metal-dependent hydrolase